MEIQQQSNPPREIAVRDGELIVPMVADPISAKALEDYLNEHDLVEKVTHLGKTAHVSGSSSYKLMRSHFLQHMELTVSNDSINNLFDFINRRGDLMRGAMARSAEESHLDKGIDTGLLAAFEDICQDYEALSSKLRAMDITDPHRAALAKEVRSLRREMLDFKELIAPAVQKMDMQAEINGKTNSANIALKEAVARLKS